MFDLDFDTDTRIDAVVRVLWQYHDELRESSELCYAYRYMGGLSQQEEQLARNLLNAASYAMFGHNFLSLVIRYFSSYKSDARVRQNVIKVAFLAAWMAETLKEKL